MLIYCNGFAEPRVRYKQLTNSTRSFFVVYKGHARKALISMTLKEYIQEINKQYQTNQAREHSYRPFLQQLLDTLLQGKYKVINEPAHSECGAPDLMIMDKGNVPVAFIETKDIHDNDLDGKRKHKAQFKRYKDSLDHIIFTDYLDFHLYEHGEQIENVRIADEINGKIVLKENIEEKFCSFIQRLVGSGIQKITSPSKLSAHMAAKARLLNHIILEACKNLEEHRNLQKQFEAFKELLVHDLTHEKFADMYAQTIVYGLFAARLNDKTPDSFSREEAANCIPETNPFLRRAFQDIAGYNMDKSIKWVVDDLIALFRATNIEQLMSSYSKNKQHEDPLMHFYEDFLSAYDPKLRNDFGVFYTPLSIVRFIVRAVDDTLKTDFHIAEGLADKEKINHDRINVQKTKKKEADTYKDKFLRVQILDPATGTGTFLAEIIKHVYKRYEEEPEQWKEFTQKCLLPRLNAFEYMMASYTIAHIKLDRTLRETGYIPKDSQRLQVYLTNTLEPYDEHTGTLWHYLAEESDEANRVKRDTPVMVVLGNPPYNSKSKNKGQDIMNLLQTYTEGLGERKHNLGDDYIKFIRYGQHLIDKNQQNLGILAYITNNSFLDGPTHRLMRKSLLQSFDKIYILNLHGNSNKQETCPDGSQDDNVFNITIGTSINIFIKTGEKQPDELGKVYYADLYGRQIDKYNSLEKATLQNIQWEKLENREPYYFFKKMDFSATEYLDGFGIDELMHNCISGIETKNDALTINYSPEALIQIKQDFLSLEKQQLISKYNLKDTGWIIDNAIADIRQNQSQIVNIQYRPFDIQNMLYTKKSSGFIGRPRYKIMRHMLQKNYGFLLMRTQQDARDFNTILVTDSVADKNFYGYQTYLYPLYIYPEQGSIDTKTMPNFVPKIKQKIEQSLGKQIDALECFDYIYALLHSPQYREKYKDFLMIAPPRIPYPTDKEKYHALAALGTKLREIHLFRVVDEANVKYKGEGDNVVTKVVYNADEQTVHINDTQYFTNVSPTAWNFMIGGDSPAHRWLNDRKKSKYTLTFEDRIHYKHIIHALNETARLMQEIDKEYLK